MGAPSRHALGLSVAVAVALAVTQALAVAPFTAGDEVAHLDYAWQVWHGRLPVFEEGLTLRPEHAWIPPVQWTAQHPPLFYLLLAPLVGPLADAGHPVGAMYAARLLGAVLAGVLVLAVRWAAAGVARPGSPLPLVAAYVTACSAVVAQAAGTVLNDVLAAVLTTTLLGLAVRVARHGLSGPLAAGLVVAAAACALARTSSMIVAAVCLVGAGLGGLVHRQLLRTAALTAATLAAVAATAGWFYARNVRLTGTVTGGNPQWALTHQGREARSLAQVLLDPVTWDRLPNLFWWGPVVPRPVGTLLLLGVPLVVAAVTHRRVLRGPVRQVLPVAVPLVAALVAVGVQTTYATSGGGLYPRYMLPVVAPLAIAVAAGLSALTAPRTADAADAVGTVGTVGTVGGPGRGGRAWRRWVLPAWTAVVLLDLALWLATGQGGSAGAAMTRPPDTPVGYPALTGPAWVSAVAAVALAAAACTAVVRLLRAGAAAPRAPRDPAPPEPSAR
ncbi:hypothetical protein DNL40_05535 [Xylanimonas oleitrophica]|uniref:Glycosyltransferase RgtA/B/C/D-like domain-containing protein n=1 Tax=Xylanimonas oleitrophica TaxID=2607479 RepID=A0A2W5WS75_9MICO|nr:hypothetical protein DNL40_05535 [Xylanimonas oleitrophica]